MLSRYRVEFQKGFFIQFPNATNGKRPYLYLLINSIYNDARRYAKSFKRKILT